MKTRLCLAALILILAAQAGSAFEYPPVKISQRDNRPHARPEQAWVEFSNEDRVDYFLDVKADGRRLRIYRDNHGRKGLVRIPSGHTVSIVVSAGDVWRLSGDTGQELPIATKRGRAAEVRFAPVIRSGKVGMSATIHDGKKNHSALMFSHWSRPAFHPEPPKHPGDKRAATPPPPAPSKPGSTPPPPPAIGPGGSHPAGKTPFEQQQEPPKRR